MVRDRACRMPKGVREWFPVEVVVGRVALDKRGFLLFPHFCPSLLFLTGWRPNLGDRFDTCLGCSSRMPGVMLGS